MLIENKINVAFLIETDFKKHNIKSLDFGPYEVIFPAGPPDAKVRIIALIAHHIIDIVRVRLDLMNDLVCSIWLSIDNKHVVGGYYRKWTVDGDKTGTTQKA